MKIGVDIRAIGRQRAGDETYTLELVRGLLDIDSDSQYFFYTDIAEDNLGEIKERINRPKSNFTIKNVPAFNRFWWTGYALPKQAKKDGVQVLHVQYITPFFFSGKLVTTVHDVSFERYPQFIQRKDLWLLKSLIPLSLKRADKIIAISNFTKKEIEDIYRVPSEKIVVAHNGGAADDFHRSITSQEVDDFRQRYNLTKPYILYLGTLQPRKNVPFLLKVFYHLKKKYGKQPEIKNLELVISGRRGGYNYDQRIDKELDKIAKDAPEIRKEIKFTGYLKESHEVPLIFKGAEVFCFPSLYEGFGLPILEAMAVGTPVVASNSSALAEVGRGAALLPAENNLTEWTKAIYALLTDQEKRAVLINKGYAQAKKFTWRKHAEKVLETYQKLGG